MKKLFIYFSLSGNGEYVADYLSTKDMKLEEFIKRNKKTIRKQDFSQS